MADFLGKLILFLFVIIIMIGTGIAIYVGHVLDDEYFNEIDDDLNESDW